jgi:hypothetical protein
MKNNKNIVSKIAALATLLLTFAVVSCERDLSDDAVFATFPPNGDVFIDSFSAGLDYFPFVGDGADEFAFSVETDDVFSGTAAMRFDVPAFGNGFVGASFNTTAARDLSGFDALTFYAKASKSASINSIGFGVDGDSNNRFRVAANNVEISTNWKKYIIPIPDATNIIAEKGLLWLSEGASSAEDEGGYIFWLDEVKFEKLGTIAQPKPRIFNGADLAENSFTGSTIQVTGLSQTFNLASGVNQTVEAAPAYFNFRSSDPDVARVSELGEITVVGEGTATITALLNGVLAEGSIEITATGALPAAPTPTRPAANVKSIFSNAYPNDTESNFTPNFGGSTTETSIAGSSNQQVLLYANNNFTGIIFDNTVDASALTFLHVDVYVQQENVEIGLQIRDIGSNGELETNTTNGFPEGDDKDFRFTLTGLTVNQWTQFEIPLAGDIATQKNNLGALIITDGPNFILDNIYFYTE